MIYTSEIKKNYPWFQFFEVDGVLVERKYLKKIVPFKKLFQKGDLFEKEVPYKYNHKVAFVPFSAFSEEKWEKLIMDEDEDKDDLNYIFSTPNDYGGKKRKKGERLYYLGFKSYERKSLIQSLLKRRDDWGWGIVKKENENERIEIAKSFIPESKK